MTTDKVSDQTAMADRVDGDLLREIEAGRFPGPALGAVSYSAMAREIRTRRAEDKKQAADAALVEHLLAGWACYDDYLPACRAARKPPVPTDAERLESIGLEVVAATREDVCEYGQYQYQPGDMIVRRREERP